MKFGLVGSIENAAVIAAGPGLRVRSYLRKVYGHGRWQKMKGSATIRLPNGALRRVESHWYEAGLARAKLCDLPKRPTKSGQLFGAQDE
jgi:hypothetical protein